MTFCLQPIGVIHPTTGTTQDLPGRGSSAVQLFPAHARGLCGIYPGQELWVLLFHVQRYHGGGGGEGPKPGCGVFATLEADRPNPIDFLRTRVLDIQPDLGRVEIEGVTAEDGCPVLDIRPATLPHLGLSHVLNQPTRLT